MSKYQQWLTCYNSYMYRCGWVLQPMQASCHCLAFAPGPCQYIIFEYPNIWILNICKYSNMWSAVVTVCMWVGIATNASGLSLFSICDRCSPRPHILYTIYHTCTPKWYHTIPNHTSYLAFMPRARHRCPVTPRPHRAYLTPCARQFSFLVLFRLFSCVLMDVSRFLVQGGCMI